MLAQALLGARVLLRLLRSAGGQRIDPSDGATAGEAVAVLVPVLNERARLGPCLDGLIAQGPEVAEILVVDGGSHDGTPELVQAYVGRDRRVRLLAAGPAPPDWNGKAWGLQAGLDSLASAAPWLLTIDADVRPAPLLARSLLAHADRTGLAALSVAVRQDLGGPGDGLVHPALLATLVYRFGIPGHATRRVGAVQANGQCFLVRRALLDGGGFAGVRESVCEDITLARALAAAGHAVGFYEAGALVSVRMYAGWRETWRNWPRSLPLRDRFIGRGGTAVGLLEVTLVQALPLPLLAALGRAGWRGWPVAVNTVLAAARLGVLLGTARAYRRRPWTYWLSPLCDLPAAVQLWRSAGRRRHEWRGRLLVRGGDG